MNAEKLEKWFRDKLPETLDDSSEYPIFLVAIGEKPGALTMNIDEEQKEVLRGVCDEFDLAIKVSEGRISKPDVAVGKRPEHDQRCAFIAQDSSRFRILEESEGRFYGFSDQAVGEFLGFPESAISFFAENEQPGMVSKKEISSREIEDKELLALTTFIPDPENLEQAVETGRERKRQLERFDREHDTSIGDYFVRRRTENSMY